MNQSLPSTLKWGKRFVFTIIDQGLFSSTNFLLNIMLARWLPPDEYGAFAIAFTVMLILSGILGSLIYEPMMVFGSTQFSGLFPIYIQRLGFIQLAMVIFLSCLSILTVFFLTGPIKIAILWMAISMPFTLSFWFFRQACYLESRSTLAAVASSIYFATITGGVILIKSENLLSLVNVYLLQALASMLGVIIISYNLLKGTSQMENKIPFRQIINIHWNYGRWILPASLVNSSANLLITPLIGIFRGLGETGVYKAYLNLITPLSQLITAFNLYFLPRLSRKYSEIENYKADRIFIKIFFFYVGITLAYLVPIHFAGNIMIDFLYNSQYYSSFSSIIPYIEIILLLTTISSILGIRVRALEKPKAVLLGKIASAAMILGTLYYWLMKTGVAGAFLALGLGLVAEIMALLISNKTSRKRGEY